MATSITTEQLLPFVLKLVDGRGRPQDYEGDAVVTSSDETVVTAAMTDRTNGVVTSVTPGDARVTVAVDADLGQGVQEVIGFLDVTVTLDDRTGARIVSLEAGTPSDKPV